jgi:hypothetical protein
MNRTERFYKIAQMLPEGLADDFSGAPGSKREIDSA